MPSDKPGHSNKGREAFRPFYWQLYRGLFYLFYVLLYTMMEDKFVGAGKKRMIGLDDAIQQYYKWKWKQPHAESCVHCKQNHQMEFETKITSNGDRHLFATCPEIQVEINMGRSVHITKRMEANEMARRQQTRQKIARHLNQVFEYSKKGKETEDDLFEIPSDSPLANLYIYERPESNEAKTIRRQMADLHENAVSYPSYETELESKVKEWMKEKATQEKSAYLPGHVRGASVRITTRDENSTVKYPRVPAHYMYHYTSDPRAIAPSIGNVPMVITYK